VSAPSVGACSDAANNSTVGPSGDGAIIDLPALRSMRGKPLN
jgi:hypothetical protein